MMCSPTPLSIPMQPPGMGLAGGISSKACQRCEDRPASSTRFLTCLFPFVPLPWLMPWPGRVFASDCGPADGSSLSAGPAAGCGSADASPGASCTAVPVCSPTARSAFAAEAASASASLACTAHTLHVHWHELLTLTPRIVLLCVSRQWNAQKCLHTGLGLLAMGQHEHPRLAYTEKWMQVLARSLSLDVRDRR